MKKTLQAITLAGLIWVIPYESGVYIGYDTNGDGIEDTRKHYVFKGLSEQGYLMYELTKTWKDTNKDGQFTEDEAIFSI